MVAIVLRMVGSSSTMRMRIMVWRRDCAPAQTRRASPKMGRMTAVCAPPVSALFYTPAPLYQLYHTPGGPPCGAGGKGVGRSVQTARAGLQPRQSEQGIGMGRGHAGQGA